MIYRSKLPQLQLMTLEGDHVKSKFAYTEPGSESPLTFALSRRDSDVVNMVRDAVTHKQTLLAFQPVVLAHDSNNIAFYEGLIRIIDETGRVIPAKDFMPAIEDSELGREIDVQALRMGLQALQRNPDLRLSVNMSARSIGYKNWSQLLFRALRRDATLGERLILEITESSAMLVPELVANFMETAQGHGVCFAMDDFGAGYTALRYFKDFYFDVLKIDGQFIRGIAKNPDNQVLTAALISIARHFDMLTVAEFVENAEDARMLQDLGLDCLQGYYYGAPSTQPIWNLDEAAKAAG